MDLKSSRDLLMIQTSIYQQLNGLLSCLVLLLCPNEPQHPGFSLISRARGVYCIDLSIMHDRLGFKGCFPCSALDAVQNQDWDGLAINASLKETFILDYSCMS